jgi:hypothetical protein
LVIPDVCVLYRAEYRDYGYKFAVSADRIGPLAAPKSLFYLPEPFFLKTSTFGAGKCFNEKR